MITHHWLAILLYLCATSMNEAQANPLKAYYRDVKYFNFNCNFSLDILQGAATFRMQGYATEDNSKTLHGSIVWNAVKTVGGKVKLSMVESKLEGELDPLAMKQEIKSCSEIHLCLEIWEANVNPLKPDMNCTLERKINGVWTLLDVVKRPLQEFKGNLGKSNVFLTISNWSSLLFGDNNCYSLLYGDS